MKNNYIIEGIKSKLVIESKKYGIIEVIIDTEDIEKMKNIKWHYQKNKGNAYICSRINGKLIRLHRYLLDIIDSNMLVDHKDRNTMNNCKLNLRVATYQKNSFNKSMRSDNNSGIVGVDFSKRANKWRAKIKYSGIEIHLGYFKDINEAIINRRLAEEFLFKEFSPNEKVCNIDSYSLHKAKKNVLNRIIKKIA